MAQYEILVHSAPGPWPTAPVVEAVQSALRSAMDSLGATVTCVAYVSHEEWAAERLNNADPELRDALFETLNAPDMAGMLASISEAVCQTEGRHIATVALSRDGDVAGTVAALRAFAVLHNVYLREPGTRTEIDLGSDDLPRCCRPPRFAEAVAVWRELTDYLESEGIGLDGDVATIEAAIAQGENGTYDREALRDLLPRLEEGLRVCQSPATRSGDGAYFAIQSLKVVHFLLSRPDLEASSSQCPSG